MAIQVRIDEMIEEASGKVRIKFTTAPGLLPTQPDGTELEFTDRSVMLNQMQALEQSIGPEQAILMRIAQHVRQTGDIALTNKLALKGRTIALDFSLSGAAAIDMK